MNKGIEAAQNQDNLIFAVGKADQLYSDAEIMDLALIVIDGVTGYAIISFLQKVESAYRNEKINYIMLELFLFKKAGAELLSAPAFCYANRSSASKTASRSASRKSEDVG